MICNKLNRHVNNFHKMRSKDYYDKFLRRPNENKCIICGKPTSFRNFNAGYAKYCSKKCSMQDLSVQEKRKQSCLQKFGVENPFQAPEIIKEIKHKTKQTRLSKSREVYTTKASIEKEQFKTENNCTERCKLIAKYGYSWYQAKIILPIYANIGGKRTSFYRNEDIAKIEDYNK